MTRFNNTILCFLLLSVLSSAQNNIRLLSGNGVFKAMVDGKSVTPSPQAEILITGITADSLQVVVEFGTNEKGTLLIYLLEKGKPTTNKEFNYRISVSKKKISSTFTGVYTIDPLRTPIVPKKPVIDTSQKYRNSFLGHLCEMKDGKAIYFNNIPEGGCVTPFPDAYLGYIKLLMEKAQVPDEKFVIAENVVRKNCHSTIQLENIFRYIEYELDKLKLIRISYVNLTDKENRKKLEKSFRFESSINELNNFYKSVTPAGATTGKECRQPSADTLMNEFTLVLSKEENDARRMDRFIKSFREYCYTIEHAKKVLGTFIHDREKIDAAKLIYFRCTEKEKFDGISDVFSYHQSASEIKEFTDKQK